MSSGLAPIRVANDWRKLRATEKKDWLSTMCGRLLAATDTCTALSATRGIAACAAKFKYVASSIGNHSFFQSIDCFNVIFSSLCSRSKGQCPSTTINGFARMALVALGKNTVSVPTLLAPESCPSQDRVPSRGRALRLWGLGMACRGLNHEVG